MNDDWNQIKWHFWTKRVRAWKLACKSDRYGYITGYAVAVGICGVILADHSHHDIGITLALIAGIVSVTAYFTRHE